MKENKEIKYSEYCLTNVIFQSCYSYCGLIATEYTDKKTKVCYPYLDSEYEREIDDILDKELMEDGKLFYCALRLAFPKVSIKAIGLCEHKSRNIIKYGASLSEKKYVYLNPSILIINNDNKSTLTNWHNLYVKFARKRGELIDNLDSDFLPIVFAERQYSQACEALTIEESIMYLYSALEALCCSPGEQISDTVSKIIATIVGVNIEDRKELQRFIKNTYGIRSKQIHGDFNEIIKIMKKSEKREATDGMYTDNVYYKLKEITSKSIYFYLNQYFNNNLSPQNIKEKIWDNFYSFDANNKK